MIKKSILTKQLFIYIGTLFISFFILGGALTVAYSNYYIGLKEKQLIEHGEKLSQKIYEQYAINFFTGKLKTDDLQYQLQVIEEYLDANVFFMNKNGVIENVTPGISQSWVGQTLTDDAIEGVLDGKIVTVKGKLNGMFPEPVLTVGYPLIIGQKVIGGVFMCTSIPEIQKSIQGMYSVGIICLVAVMIIGAFLVYISTRRITKPLLEMNDAVKVIANGNFENRLEVNTDDEVGQLAESFNNMAESLDKHEKIRRDFIANISHDLRSPLTSIQGFIGAILDGTIPVEKQQHYLEIVMEETSRLTKLTNDIVDLSRAQTSNLTLEETEFNINELIRDSIEKLEPRFKEKDISVDIVFFEKDTIVKADEDKIRRVFHNLVDNALKFTDVSGNIKIETALKNNNKITVSVKDNGKGISEEDQKYVFDRFYKADASRGEDKKGGGLGLSIAKQFILAHGENICVKSEESKGTEFIFTLKLAM